MKQFRLDEMVKGWFVGPFAPSALHSAHVEVALKSYRAGDREPEHLHRVATELTLVVSGVVRMLGREWRAGDIVVLEPGTATAFEALTDAVNVVVKTPAVPGDKYLTDAGPA